MFVLKYINSQVIYKNIKQYTVTSQTNVTCPINVSIRYMTHNNIKEYTEVTGHTNVMFVLRYFLNQVIMSPLVSYSSNNIVS